MHTIQISSHSFPTRTAVHVYIAEMASFFDLNIKILKLSGLWVPNSNNSFKYKKAITYNSICILYSMIYFTIAELVSLKESAANLNDLVKNLNMLMSFLLTLIKIIVWFRYRKDILKIIAFIDTRKNVFKNYNFDSEEIVLKELQFKDTWTKSFFVMSTLVPLSAGILSITETITKGEEYVVFRNDSSLVYVQKLPYYSWIPFDHSSSKWSFAIAVVSQCIALLNCGYITVGKVFNPIFNLLIYIAIFSRFGYDVCSVNLLNYRSFYHD